MNGFIEVPNRKRKFPYIFEEDTLTIYRSNSLPLDTPTELGITSSNKYLLGTDTASNSCVIFFVNDFPFEGTGPLIWSATEIGVYYYIDGLDTSFSFMPREMHFSFDELDYFFNVNSGVKRNILSDGTRTIETVPYNDTKKTFSFTCKNQLIVGEIGIIPTMRTRAIIPLELHNQLTFEFEVTNSIDFLLDLYAVVQRLFYILCYRRNIQIDTVKLYGVNEEGRRCRVGVFHPLYSQCSHIEDKKTWERMVNYTTLEFCFPKLVQAIADEKVYIEHIPETKKDGSSITVARTILVTAAFEWNFKQTYGALLTSAYRSEVKEDILRSMDRLAAEKVYNKKKRSELNLYQKIVTGVNQNLSEKIQLALKDCNTILEGFIKHIYEINGMQVPAFSQIANDLQYQRNSFAHGDIDKEIKDDIILEVIILEWLNYCMLFKRIGYDEADIHNAINRIFSLGL